MVDVADARPPECKVNVPSFELDAETFKIHLDITANLKKLPYNHLQNIT